MHCLEFWGRRYLCDFLINLGILMESGFVSARPRQIVMMKSMNVSECLSTAWPVGCSARTNVCVYVPVVGNNGSLELGAHGSFTCAPVHLP